MKRDEVTRAADAITRVAEKAYDEWRKANPNATTLEQLAKVWEIGGVILGSRAAKWAQT